MNDNGQMVADDDTVTVKVPYRKRAPGACLTCRTRKVRCDVAQRGAPCTNCSLDRNDCIVKARPTKYRTAKSSNNKVSKNGGHPPIPQPSDATPSTNQFCMNSWPEQSHALGESKPSANLPDAISYEEQHETSDYGDSLGRSEGDTYGNSEKHIGGPRPASRQRLTEHLIPDSSTPQGNCDPPESINTEVIFSFYPFLELDIQSHMSPYDVNFLEQQSCFRVPTEPALDELIREYFLHVHPSLPIIDEGKFWEVYTYRGFPSPERSRISLFLFQSMLFASCSFLSLAGIRRLGFPNTRAARAAYYRKAKLLFDFNGEKDPIYTAQGALLLAYNSSVRNYKQVNTFWLEIAIQSAKDGDAHLYQTKVALTPERRNMLKRLWWCCIVRDRILPLGVRRPLRIGATDFDFAAEPLSEEDFESEVRCSRVYSSHTKSSLVELFLALCSLAVSLTEVITTLYPANGPPDVWLLDEQKLEQYYVRIESCKSNLTTWFEKAIIEFPTPAGIGDIHESVILYTNLMYMYYYSAMLALYHHEILAMSIKPAMVSSHWNRMCHSRRRVEEATSAITDNLKELVQLKLAHYLPISIVAYAALPLVLHVLDTKLSTTNSQTARRQRHLNIYTEAMKVLKSHYDGTDEVSDAIGTMMNYVTLERPSQGSCVNIDENNNENSQDRIGCRSALSIPIKYSNTINDWGDVLLRRTKLYLRLAITVDLSLSKSRFPRDVDFPIFLQSPSLIETRFPLYRIPIEDPLDSGIETMQGLPDGQYPSVGSSNTKSNTNRPSTSLNSTSRGLAGQIEAQLNHSSVHFELSTYSAESFDLCVPDNNSSVFDHPTAWADGMFLDDR